MAIERIVDTSSHVDDIDEQRIEVSLRPQNFSEYIGQDRLKKNLQLAIKATKSVTNRLIMYYFMVHQVWVKQQWQV